MHRVEGLEVRLLIVLQRIFVFYARQNGQIDGVVIICPGCQRAVQDHLVGLDIFHAERIAQTQLVLRQRAGLIRTQHIHPRQFLDRHQPTHHGLFFGEQTRADRHRHGQHRRHCHGNCSHGKYQSKLQGGEDRVAPVNGNANDHGDHNQRQNDQVIADFQDGALKMADGMGRLHELRGLAEIGVLTCGIDQCADFALADNRAGKHRLAGFACGRQGFPCQRGLIHFHRVTIQQACIRWHNIA